MCVRAQNKPVYGENSVLKGKWGLPGGGIDFPMKANVCCYPRG